MIAGIGKKIADWTRRPSGSAALPHGVDSGQLTDAFLGESLPTPPAKPSRQLDPAAAAAHRVRAKALWSEASVRSALAATAPVAGLSAAAIAGLEKLLSSLNDDGTKLYATIGPPGASNPADERALTPHEALRAVTDASPLYVGSDGSGRYPVASLRDLQALDAVHFSGADAHLDRSGAAADVVHGLYRAGFETFHTTQNGNTWEKIDPLAAWKVADRQAGERGPSRAIRIAGPQRRNLLEETDDHPEVKQLMKTLHAGGGGPDYYESVGTLVDRGWEIGYVDFPVRAPYAGPQKDMVTMFTPFALYFSVPVADLGDAEKLERQVQAQVAAQERFLQPSILGGTLGSDATRGFAEAMLYACPELTSERSGEALSQIMPLVDGAPAQKVMEAARTLHEIRERTPDRTRLETTVGDVVSILRSPELEKTGWRERQALALDAVAHAESTLGDGKARAAFFELVRNSQDVASSIDVLAVLRRQGDFDERLAVYRSLSQGDLGVPITDRDLAAIVDARLPGEDMASAAARFAALYNALKDAGQQGQSRDVLTHLRDACERSEGRLALETAQNVFLCTWVHGRDVERGLRSVDEAALPPRAAGTVTDEGATVQIGKVRVRKNSGGISGDGP